MGFRNDLSCITQELREQPEGCKQNKIPVRDVQVVRIGMIKGKESPAIGRRVIKTSRYPLAPDEDVRRLTRTMNTRFTSGEKIAVGGRCAVEEGEGGRGHESRGRNGQQRAPAIHEYQRLKINCFVLRVSHARSSGQEPMIPRAESCGSVGKLGDPEGATTSNGDVREEGKRGERRAKKTRRDTGGQREEDTKGEKEEKEKWKYEIVPPGEKTAVVFPSAVEEEDERDRSPKTDRKGGGERADS